MAYLKWGGKKWYPQKPQPYKADINELMKPLSEKVNKGNVWGSVIMNVEKGATPVPSPTPSITPTPTPTPTPVPSFDPDAQAFFNAITGAGGSLTTTEQDATNQLVLDLKGYGLWSKMIGLWPVVGATAVEHQFNLADPTQYNLTFNGTWTHSTTKVAPGANGYADTGINPRTIQFDVAGSIHYSMYIVETKSSGGYDMGGYDSVGGDFAMLSSFLGNNTAYIGVGAGFITVGNGGDTKKNWLMTNTGGTSYIYRDGAALTSGAKTISVGPNLNMYISCNNNNGSAGDFSARDWALASIGYGMDATEAANYNTAVVTFQTALGRQN